MAKLSSDLFVPEFSTDGTTWKQLICITDWNFDLDAALTEEDTFCGSSTGVGIPKGKGSANFVAEFAPSGSQVSAEDVVNWVNSRQALSFRVQYPTSGTPGSDLYLASTGATAKMNHVNIQGAAKNNLKGTVDWFVDGVIDNTP